MKKEFSEEEMLNKYTKAFVHTVYRNGPVEDIHVNFIRDSEMKVINKYMVNRFGYIFSHTIFGKQKTEDEQRKVVDMVVEYYVDGIGKETKEYVLKFDDEKLSSKFALGMFYFVRENSPLEKLLDERKITEKQIREIYTYMLRRMILLVKGHMFSEKLKGLNELNEELDSWDRDGFGTDWDEIELLENLKK